MSRPSPFALAFVVAVGCSPAGTTHPGGGGGGSGGGGGGGGGDDCSDAARLIYATDEDGSFYSFTPNQKDVTKSTFTRIGHLDCPGAQGSPFSMSLDRDGVAWVEYSGGWIGGNQLFQVST